MKLLDNLVLTTFTIIVSTVSIGKVISLQINTSKSNNTIAVEWKNLNENLHQKAACYSLIISNSSYSKEVIQNTNYELDCNEPYQFGTINRCIRIYRYTANNLNQCTNYTFKTECEVSFNDEIPFGLPSHAQNTKQTPKKKHTETTHEVSSYNLPREPVKNITTTFEKNVIQIRWSESANQKLCIHEYRIILFSKEENITETTSVYGFLLTGLKPNQTYSGNVTAIYTDKEESSNTIEEFTTDEKLEIPKFKVSAESKEPKTGEIIWHKPNINHEIRRYDITYYIIDIPDQNQTVHDIDKDSRKYKLLLEPCKYHTIIIRPIVLNFGNDLFAKTKIFVIDTGTCMKPTKDSKIKPNFQVYPNQEKREIKLTIPKKLFLNYTELISNYSIFLHIDNENVPAQWPSLITNENTWAYMESNPTSVFFYRSSPDGWIPDKEDENDNFVYLIGENEKCSKADQTTFCNGPLKSKRKYQLAVRICSERGCVYSWSIDFYSIDSNNGDNKGYSYPLPLIFLLTLASILFVAAVIFMLCTIRVQDYDPMHSIIKKSMPSDITFQQLLTKTLEEIYTEYNLLDVFFKSNPTTYIAMLPKNRSKNRYSDILPYDYNRVKLKSDNDYINASFIYDFDSVQKYIACQGPMTNTFEDMWNMVLEQNIVSIVMLCKMIENDKKKCDKYFPDVNTNLELDGIIVQNNNTTVSKNRSFTANKLTVIKGNTQKTVNHFQFHDWPDFGTPDEYSILMDFCQKVNAASSDGLIVVHCSAGVGRTGTYIACDMLLKLIDRSNKLNIFKTVLHLRKQRTNMVQTQEQYNFIYGFLGNFINPYL